MLALYFDSKNQLKEIAEPVPASYEALIAAGICHTDIEIKAGYMDFRGVLGHEFISCQVSGKRKALKSVNYFAQYSE